MDDHLLVRRYKRPEDGILLRQVMVPKKLRNEVLLLGHEGILVGHLGIKKSSDRILTHFYWPGIFGDIRRCCQSCDICQRTVNKGSVRKVPVQSVPWVHIPFDKVAIDLIGPLYPVTNRGKRYILIVVDYASRYPEAVPLEKIDTESIAEALMGIFSRVGFPREILSDNGTQFVSQVAELDRMVTSEVIRVVTEPTDWCSAMVPVVGKNGTVRICVDLKRLNIAVRREHLMLPSLDDIAPKLAHSKVFSTLDAASGFWQIPLDENSQLMTTFITPFGRYAFRRLPFGISSAPEIFQRKMSSLLEGLSGVEVIMDDILVHGRDLEEHDACLTAVIRRIDASGLKLNPNKCVLRQSELRYFGHIITENGVKPDPARVKALLELSPPNNISELRTVLGMFQYLAKFAYNMSAVMKPMTDLLRADVCWSWDHAQQSSFDETKRLLTITPTLSYYETIKPTVVSADASSFGIGAVLMQTTDGELKPIAFASRTLTSAEQRYSQLEKECLAGVWACEKFSRYLVGLSEFKLLTDHRPLVPLMNTRSIDDTPIRCQRLLMRAMRYNPIVEYVPGKLLVIADALSRKQLEVRESQKDDIELSDDVAAYVDAIERGWPATKDRLTEIRLETMRDPTMKVIASFIENGWPRHERSVPHSVRDYFRERSSLSISDGLIIYNLQIVVPPNMRADILQHLHETHQGISKCRELVSKLSSLRTAYQMSSYRTMADNSCRTSSNALPTRCVSLNRRQICTSHKKTAWPNGLCKLPNSSSTWRTLRWVY